MKFPEITETVRLQKLKQPTGKIRMVLDTDTYNEIDDQFAVVYSLISPEKLDVEAIYAAPFFNTRSSGPRDGMERSYEEILRLLERLKISPENFAYKGSTEYLSDTETPCKSDAVNDLVERAMKFDDDDPLYVVAIGAITNIASAILLEPEIINKIVVVWLGGHAFHWPNTAEFNLGQDLIASRIIFDCGVPLIQIPCMGVTSHLHTTVPELEKYVKGSGAIGDYLFEIYSDFKPEHCGWSKVIWDISTIAYLIDPSFVPTEIVHSPIVTDQKTWSFDNSRHFIRSAYMVHRDPIFKDFFKKLAECVK
ncbi:MAG: nucleoside hydrolase [Chlamydiae bacterium]|nr:MAG: nucleoside hydrolase [Chlamydiota bacterium]